MQKKVVYMTADKIGINTGGGSVTYQERQAMASLGFDIVVSQPRDDGIDPFQQDAQTLENVKTHENLILGHFYAGCHSQCIDYLKSKGIPTTATAAAHDVEVSRREHEKLGLEYGYPHITQPELWERYVRGYLNSDVLVCPSRHSASVMAGFGAKNPIQVIPHGVHIPERVTDPPLSFCVGHMGTCGAPDKGLRYLLEAWRKLGYTDATLVLAGRDSTSPWVQHLIRTYGGGNIRLLGWVDKLEDFYSQVSLYIQPSCSEGFGLEVLESLAHSRQVLCSTGAGAADCVPKHWTFSPCNADDLAGAIDYVKSRGPEHWKFNGQQAREMVKPYSWLNVRMKYQDLWRSLL